MNIDIWQMSHSFPLAACGSEERDMRVDLQLPLPNARPPCRGQSPLHLQVCAPTLAGNMLTILSSGGFACLEGRGP